MLCCASDIIKEDKRALELSSATLHITKDATRLEKEKDPSNLKLILLHTSTYTY